MLGNRTPQAMDEHRRGGPILAEWVARAAHESGYAPASVVLEEVPVDGLAVKVVEETDDYAVGVLDRAVLLRTRTPITPAAFEAAFRHTTTAMAEFGPNVLYAIIPGAPQPSISEAAHARIAELWPRIQAQSTAGVIWDRTRGFTSVIVRKLVAEMLPHLRDRSLLGITASARETVEFFVAGAAEFDIDVQGWVEALEAFGRRYDR